MAGTDTEMSEMADAVLEAFGNTVTYRRRVDGAGNAGVVTATGSPSATITTLSLTAHEGPVRDEGLMQSREFFIKAADLAFSGSAHTPIPGDSIVDSDGDTRVVKQVEAQANRAMWKLVTVDRRKP